MTSTSSKDRIADIQKRTKRVWVHDSFLDRSLHDLILGDIPELDEYERARQMLVSQSQPTHDWAACGCVEPLLSKEQEQHLFRKLSFLKWRARTIACRKNVTSASLDEAEDLLSRADKIRQQIVLCNVRLGIKHVTDFYQHTNFVSDLISESFIVINRCAEYFDWTKGNRFSTYVVWSFRRSFKDRYHRFMKRNKEYKAFENADLSFIADDREYSIDALSAKMAVPALLKSLNKRERTIMRQRYHEGMTFESIGQGMGITKVRVRQITNACFKKIRARLGDELVEQYEEALRYH